MKTITFYNLPGFKDNLKLTIDEESYNVLIKFYREANRDDSTGCIWITDSETGKKYYIRLATLASCTMEIE